MGRRTHFYFMDFLAALQFRFGGKKILLNDGMSTMGKKHARTTESEGRGDKTPDAAEQAVLFWGVNFILVGISYQHSPAKEKSMWSTGTSGVQCPESLFFWADMKECVVLTKIMHQHREEQAAFRVILIAITESGASHAECDLLRARMRGYLSKPRSNLFLRRRRRVSNKR